MVDSFEFCSIYFLDLLAQWLEHSVYNRGLRVRVSPWASSLKISLLVPGVGFLCPVGPLYFLDEKSTTVEQ